MRTPFTRLAGATLLLLAAGSGTSVAQQAMHSAINLDDSGVIIQGYDVVAYQRQQAAVPGSAEHTAVYEGAIYRFTSRENRDAFRQSPTRYAPQYGGYCAMGVALGKKLNIDPEVFRVVDGKLYLNLNKDVQKDWLKDIPGNIAKAEKNWPKVKDLPLS